MIKLSNYLSHMTQDDQKIQFSQTEHHIVGQLSRTRTETTCHRQSFHVLHPNSSTYIYLDQSLLTSFAFYHKWYFKRFELLLLIAFVLPIFIQFTL